MQKSRNKRANVMQFPIINTLDLTKTSIGSLRNQDSSFTLSSKSLSTESTVEEVCFLIFFTKKN